ncbi:MAG: hypothetical protein JKY81_04175 [Colwellia sp.]|nr:hypothetical protein [Colwellia sp.]
MKKIIAFTGSNHSNSINQQLLNVAVEKIAELMPWWGGDVKATYSFGSYFEKMVDGKLVPEADEEIL